jgi:hypothetical protein
LPFERSFLPKQLFFIDGMLQSNLFILMDGQVRFKFPLMLAKTPSPEILLAREKKFRNSQRKRFAFNWD